MWLIVRSILDESRSEESPKKYVKALKKFTDIDEYQDRIRISPIFPFDGQNEHSLFEDSIDGTFVMLFPKNAGKLFTYLQNELQVDEPEVFYTFGLCSVILFFKHKKSVDFVYDKSIQSMLVTFEIWEVNKNEIVSSKDGTILECPSPIDLDFSRYQFVNDYPLFQELLATTRTFSLYCSKYSGVVDFRYEMLLIEVNNLLEQYEKLLPTKKKERTKLFQLEDKAVQLISNISYLTTQAFSGIVPLMERRSILRRHTLFGIGNSIRALSKVVNHIVVEFEEFDLIARIRENFYQQGSCLEGLSWNPFKYDRAKWKAKNIESLSFSAPTKYQNFKLPFYSARLGFRETEYAISAKIQSITYGLSKEWSILTLTHELMHDQVRRLVNFILFDELESEEENTEKYSEYASILKDKVSNGFSDSDRLIDSVRAIIYGTCLVSESTGSLTFKSTVPVNTAAQKKLMVPDNFRALADVYNKHSHSIIEVFVHLFDYHYIYRGEIKFYLKSIWRTWFTVNNVFSNLREYVLRSLLVASTRVKSSDEYDRFEESINILRDAVLSINAENEYIAEVVDYLNHRCIDECSSTFMSYLRLVDMVCDLFLSDNLSDRLIKDDNMSSLGEMNGDIDFTYNGIDRFDIELGSPLSYLIARLEYVDQHGGDISLDYHTCISYLAFS